METRIKYIQCDAEHLAGFKQKTVFSFQHKMLHRYLPLSDFEHILRLQCLFTHKYQYFEYSAVLSIVGITLLERFSGGTRWAEPIPKVEIVSVG
jgi:hypothetical protein